MGSDEVVQLITNVGFPIAMCLLMYYQMNKQQESHKAEIEKLSQAVNNNTLVLEKLQTILERRGTNGDSNR